MSGLRLLSNRRPRLLATLIVGSLAALALAPAALAGQGIWVKLVNTTKANLNLMSRDGSNCWDGEDLNHAEDKNFVPAGGVRTYYSEKKTSGGCGNSDGYQNIQVKVQDEGTRWQLPSGSPPDYRLVWRSGREDHGLNLEGGLTTWVPRADGKGLLCLHAKILDENHADLYAYQNGECNKAVPEATRPGAKVAPPSAPTPLAATPPRTAGAPGAEGGADKSNVINVLSAVEIACEWFVHPDDPKACADLKAGDPTKWSIDNLPADVRDFRLKRDAEGKPDLESDSQKFLVAANEVSIPPGGGSGQLSVSESVAMSEGTTSTTTKGGKLGEKFAVQLSVKTKIPFVGEGGVTYTQETNTETNWSESKAVTNSKTTTKSVGMSVPAPAGFTTKLQVFTTKRAAHYIYEADLDFGDPEGQPTNVTTPATIALGQSPAARQPCLGYVVGSDAVRNSIVNIGTALKNQGWKPDDSSLPEDKRAFIASIDSYRSGTTPCEGFPAGYSSAAGFKGEGVGSYSNFGYGLDGKPVSTMTGCVYMKPYQPKGPPTARTLRLEAAARDRIDDLELKTGDEAPCSEVSIRGGVVEATPGVLVEDSNLGGEDAKAGFAGPTADGTPGSDLIVGPEDGGAVRTGGGALDTVETGSGDTRVYATAKENVVQAQGGDDLLVGGGNLNYLYGGGGGDRLVDDGGIGELFGEGGGDVMEGHDMTGAMVGGGGDDQMIGTGNLAGLSMAGGPGSNVYVVEGSGTPAIVQAPGPGRSRVLTVHSLTVPPNVAVGRAIGDRRVTLRGADARELIAGKGGATLIAGPEPGRLRGGRKADTIVCNDQNDDVAVGGGGGDRFVFSGSSESDTRPAGLPAPPHPAAPLIKDFTPSQGDRLVMKASVFGRQVLDLGKRFEVVASARPRPRTARPTLLLDTRDGLVYFDRDGSGPISDRVVVKLPGAHALRRGWFAFTRR